MTETGSSSLAVDSGVTEVRPPKYSVLHSAVCDDPTPTHSIPLIFPASSSALSSHSRTSTYPVPSPISYDTFVADAVWLCTEPTSMICGGVSVGVGVGVGIGFGMTFPSSWTCHSLRRPHLRVVFYPALPECCQSCQIWDDPCRRGCDVLG